MKYDFNKVTDRKNTFSIKTDLATKRGKPEDVLPLWVADMDFPTAPCILDALESYVRYGIFGYSRPDERYYTAVKEWFRKRFGWETESEWIVNTPGVVYAIATAIRAFTKPEESVIIQQPVYYPFSATIRAQKRNLVNSPLILRNGRYEIDFQDFEEKIITNKVKLFILCSPHNPGGRVWTATELEKLAEICLRHDVKIVSDEIHSDFVFSKTPHTIFAKISKEVEQNSIICTSPSKTFNLAGLQFSNIFIPNKKLRTLFLDELTRTGYDEPSLMGIIAATAAYQNGGDWLDELKIYIQENIAFAEDFLLHNCPKIKPVHPEGTYLLWLDFSEIDGTDSEIDARIVNRAKVWLDRGTMFGKEGYKFQRINCATPRTILQEALEKICKEFAEKE